MKIAPPLHIPDADEITDEDLLALRLAADADPVALSILHGLYDQHRGQLDLQRSRDERLPLERRARWARVAALRARSALRWLAHANAHLERPGVLAYLPRRRAG